MRLTVVTLLGFLALCLAVPPCLAAPSDATFNAARAPDTFVAVPADRVDQKTPADWFWPGGLMIGYISLGLKSQLRRRGFLDAPRGRTFSGLISLTRKPAAHPVAAYAPDRRADDERRDS
jgi:hypothetical protein